MALTPEERRRRQAIDTDPANKCQAPEGCGNTARLGERYCGAHMPNGLSEIEQRIASRMERLNELQDRISSLPILDVDDQLRPILHTIVENLR